MIVDYLKQFNRKFSVIAVSWLSNDNVNTFSMQGYEMYHINRTNKKGGGVALYVDIALKCKQVTQTSPSKGRTLEIVTAEAEVEKG